MSDELDRYVSEVQEQSPDRIWLQIDPDELDPRLPYEGVTWCSDRINDTDVEYIRADTVAELRAWAHGAYVCLREGTALMPREQLGQWGGVRGLIESYPGEDE